MKTMKLFNALLVTGSVLALGACTDKEEIEGDGHGFDEATFQVEVVSVGKTEVSVKTSATGDPDATYWGFLTDDVVSPAADLISDELGGVSVTRHILSTGTVEVPAITGLRQGGKAYRYIVTGLLANGSTYGTPAEAVFTTAGDFTKDAAWAVTYPDPEFDPTTVKVSGTGEVQYVFGMMTQEAYKATSIKEIVNGDLDGDEELELLSGDQEFNLEITESGDYVAYIYGVADGAPTLQYAELAFTVGNLDFSAYEAFLGDWYFDASSDVMITLSVDKKGRTYSVSGLPGEGAAPATYPAVIATFDKAANALVLSEQDLNTFVLSQYGDCMAHLSGIFTYNDVEYNYYPFNGDDMNVIFSATMGADGDLTVTPGSCAYGQYAAFNYNWTILGGDNAGKGNSATRIAMPTTLNREVGSASDEYNAWLGKWYAPDGTEFEIAADKLNATFTVTGFVEGMTLTTRFLKEDGSMEFYSQTMGSTDQGDVVFCGRDQDDYVEQGDQDGSARLANAVLAADGKSFTITGAEYVATYSGTQYDEIIVMLQPFLFSEGKIYTISGAVSVALPSVWTGELPAASDEYKAWLGNWSIVRVPEVSHEATQDDVDAGKATNVGDKVVDSEAVVDVWTFEEDKTNATYAVTGIEGTEFKVIANFDATTSGISISEQNVISETDSNDNNIFAVNLFGNFIYSGKTYFYGGTKQLFTAVIGDGGNAVMTPSATGYGVDFSAMRFYAKIGANTGNYAYTSAPTPLENVLIPAGASSAPAKVSNADLFVVDDVPATAGSLSNAPSFRKGASRFDSSKAMSFKLVR